MNKDESKILSLFKEADINIFTMASKSFSEFSKYLSNKYLIKINKNQNKKIIKFYYVDFDSSFNIIRFISYDILKDKYIFEINSNNPDYLFYGSVGKKHLNPKYNNSIIISYQTENKIADFENTDYCIGNHNIIYLDRYLKYPRFIYIYRLYKSQYKKRNIFTYIRKKVLRNKIRNKFCGAVISNANSTDYLRLNFIEKLNLYKKVDMGGRFGNNVGGRVKNKIKFLSSYKFSIAMENSNGDGYVTEKIIDSFLSGTIPIYYGNYMVEEFINPKTYILIKGPKDIDKKINFIKQIDNNNTLYKQIIKEKVLFDEKIDDKFERNKLYFIDHIFEQDKYLAKRR